MLSPTVNLELSWGEDVPDGSVCNGCGDQCFLMMWRAFVSGAKIVKLQPLDCVLCDSCYRAVVEGN